MAAQLRHMVRATERPNVAVQVVPFDRGAHIALNGPYLLLEFAKAQSVVHLEHTRSSLFVDDPENVMPWRKSSHSGTDTNCVEVAAGHHRAGGGAEWVVAVRDSKDPAGPVLRVAPGDWAAFLTAVHRGAPAP